MPHLIAHRGYSSRHLENSPEAWRAAAEAGADFVEIDVRFTADMVAVCCHDADLERLLADARPVAELPHAQLAALRAQKAGAVPDLATALSAVPPSCGMVLDVKDERPEALARLHDMLEAAGRDDIVTGFHHLSSVRYMAARGHRRILGFTLDVEDSAAFVAEGTSILRLWQGDAMPQRLAALAQLDVPIWITTGGPRTPWKGGDFEPSDLRVLASLGAGGFIINDPAAARGALDTKANDRT